MLPLCPVRSWHCSTLRGIYSLNSRQEKKLEDSGIFLATHLCTQESPSPGCTSSVPALLCIGELESLDHLHFPAVLHPALSLFRRSSGEHCHRSWLLPETGSRGGLISPCDSVCWACAFCQRSENCLWDKWWFSVWRWDIVHILLDWVAALWCLWMVCLWWISSLPLFLSLWQVSLCQGRQAASCLGDPASPVSGS